MHAAEILSNLIDLIYDLHLYYSRSNLIPPHFEFMKYNIYIVHMYSTYLVSLEWPTEGESWLDGNQGPRVPKRWGCFIDPIKITQLFGINSLMVFSDRSMIDQFCYFYCWRIING